MNQRKHSSQWRGFYALLFGVGLIFHVFTVEAQDLVIGDNSSSQITNFTSVVKSYENIYVGAHAGDANNFLEVGEAGELFANLGSLVIGIHGSGNNLTVNNGGSVGVSAFGVIGYAMNSSENSVLVTGSNSTLSTANTLFIGQHGSRNSLTISNGGNVTTAASTAIGDAIRSSDNSVLVTGSNSTLSTFHSLYIGHDGNGNSLVVSNGGNVTTAAYATIGHGIHSSDNSVLVTGSNSTLSTATNLFVGNYGSVNSLTIAKGAVVTASGFTTIGWGTNSSDNSVLVTGSNSMLSTANSLLVGQYGSRNSLVVSNGGIVTTSAFATLGWGTNSSGNSVLVTGSNSTLSTFQSLDVGHDGNGNSLTISNGGNVTTAAYATIGWGTNSSRNSILVTGIGSSLSTASNFTVGARGSWNRLLISNGASVLTAANAAIGYGTNSYKNSVLVTGSNSSWSNNGVVVLGDSGVGTLTVTHAASVSAANIVIANQSTASGFLNIGSYGRSDPAGSINAPGIAFGRGTGTINLNQDDAFSLSCGISGKGSLYQLGTGTTILSGSNSYTGETLLQSGTLVAGNSLALGTSSVILKGTGRLSMTSLALSNFDWKSTKSFVLLDSLGASNYLTVNGAMNVSAGIHDFVLTDFSLGSTPTLLMEYAPSNNLSIGSFGVLGVTDYTLSVSNTGDMDELFVEEKTASPKKLSLKAAPLEVVEMSNSLTTSGIASDNGLTGDVSGGISIEGVPEPSCNVLLVFGALGLFVASLRRACRERAKTSC